MDAKEFAGVLTLLTSSLIQIIEENNKLRPQEAATQLYSSKLYAKLEQEESKLWHLSAEALFDLLEEEISTGSITYPEEA